MRRLLVSLIVAAFVAPVGAPQSHHPPQVSPHSVPPPAQANPPLRSPTIRKVVNLVLIDVQVTDHAGKPIKGLKPEQFTVLEDGKPQKISSFNFYDIERLETAATTDVRPIVVPVGALAITEKVQQAVRDHRMVVLFFDLTAMEPAELLRARGAAERYVRQLMTPADLASVVAFGNRLNVLCDFTNDRAVLARAVARLRPGKESQLAEMADAAAQPGEAVVSEDTGAAFTPDEAEFNIFNTDRKLEALESLADLLHGIPGRKSVVYFTGGIAQTGEENLIELRAAVDAANRSDASFYAVDARGLLAQVPGGEASLDAPLGMGLFAGEGVSRRTAGGGRALFTGAAMFHEFSMRHNSRQTLATLAADTGGRSFFDLGDLSDAFRKVQQDFPGYYLVGYYSNNSRRDGRWRQVKVRIAGVPGVRVRFREGYYAPKDNRVYSTEDRVRQMVEAMSSETPRVEFPVALETDYFRMNDREFYVPIAAKLASSALDWATKRGRHEVEFDFAAEVRDVQSGRAVAALQDSIKVSLGAERFQQLQRALLYQGGVILGPGNYRLKFLARENGSGRISTFEQDLSLPPLARNHLELSSLLLSSQMETLRNSSEVQRKGLGIDAKLKTTPLDVSGERIIPSVTRVFTTQQELYVFFQAYLPPKTDPSKLRAGLIFFRNGAWSSETPLVGPAAVDPNTQIASFRLSLPLEKFALGSYTVQAVVVEEGAERAAFARNYFAVRFPPRS